MAPPPGAACFHLVTSERLQFLFFPSQRAGQLFAFPSTIERIGASEQSFCTGNLRQVPSLPEKSAIGRRSHTAHAAELAIKVGQIRETNFKGNQAYGKISFRQAHTGASDAELAVEPV